MFRTHDMMPTPQTRTRDELKWLLLAAVQTLLLLALIVLAAESW